MKISIEVDSLQELRDFCFESGFLVAQDRIDRIEKVGGELSKRERKQKAEEKAQKVNEKAQKATENDEQTSKTEEKTSAPDVGKLIVKARKVLKMACDKAGRNIAKEWIAEEGYEGLSDIKDAETMGKLITRGEEYVNGE